MLFFQVQTTRTIEFEDFESDFFPTPYDFANPKPLELTKTGLQLGVTYFFRVVCVTQMGFGSPSTVFTGVIDAAPRVMAVLPNAVPSLGQTLITVVVDGWRESLFPGSKELLSGTIDTSKCNVSFDGFGEQDVESCYVWDNSGVSQTVFVFHSPPQNGGPTRHVEARLSIKNNNVKPRFPVKFLQAPSPSVLSITGAGVVKMSSNR